MRDIAFPIIAQINTSYIESLHTSYRLARSLSPATAIVCDDNNLTQLSLVPNADSATSLVKTLSSFGTNTTVPVISPVSLYRCNSEHK